MPHLRQSTLPTGRLGVLALSLAILGAPAHAQQPTPAVDDAVTVTAQRVEQDLQDVPISILTVAGEEIGERALGDVQELATEIPGLTVTGQAASNGEMTLTIRGIGANTFGLGTETTVGYYVDGIYMPRPQTFVTGLLDIERVEVLRGPQGTLWGRNSTGGAINVVTKAPSSEFRGRLFANFGEFDTAESPADNQFGLTLGGALTETVWARLSGVLSQSEDPTFNAFSNRTVDNQDGYTARAALTFLPSDSVSVTVRADSTDNDAHNNFNFRAGGILPDSTLGSLQRFYGLAESPDIRTVNSNILPIAEYEESGFSVDLNWVVSDRVNFTSLSSYREYDSFRQADIDGTELDFVENVSNLEGEWWSQEFQLDGRGERFDWIAGAYLFHEEGFNNIDNRTDTALFEVDFFARNPQLFLFNPVDFCSLGIFAPTFLCGPDYYNALAPFFGLSQPGTVSTGNFFRTELETDSWAVYGQFYWHLNDRLTLTLGARYTDDQKDHDQTSIDFITQAPIRQVDSGSWDGFTPKVGLEYRLDDDTLLFGSVTTGFKSGGFNSVSIQPSFDEETITSTEIGIKKQFADRRVTLNASVFNYQYDDLQVAVLFPDRSQVENAAEATVNGLDFDLTARPTDRFTLQVGVELLDDEFDEFASQNPVEVAAAQNALQAMGNFDQTQIFLAGASVPVTDLSGRSLQRAPDLQARASAQYVFDLGGGGSLTARGMWSTTDDLNFDPFGELAQESWDVINANLRYTPRNGSWWINLYGQNLGDEEYKANEIFFSVAGSLQVWAPPRAYGVQLGFDW